MERENKPILTACDKAQIICDKNQYKEATLIEKIKLSFHLLICKACQMYTKNNSKLTKLMNNEKVTSFKPNEKSDLEELFKQELKKAK